MSASKQPYVPPELQQRIDLGKAGKLWTIEVIYNCHNEVKKIARRNLKNEEVQEYRETMFRYGLTIPVEPGHWQIICPYDIARVDLYKQSGYFPE